MLRKISIFILLCIGATSLSTQAQSVITLGENDVALDTGDWLVQTDVEGYHAVLNSNEGIYDFMFANQYVPEGEAVIAITDQRQFEEWSGVSSQAIDAESLALEIEMIYGYAIDMTPEVIASESDNIYRLRINFGTLKQYAYVVDFDGHLSIFYLFVSTDTVSPEYETDVVRLIESATASNDVQDASTPEFFARSLSNDAWVIYGAESSWIVTMNSDYHKLIMEQRDETSGYLSLSFFAADHYDQSVFSQTDANSIIMAAKGYQPPYDPPDSIGSLTQVAFGDNIAQAIEFAYTDRTYVYALFELNGNPSLVIANYENAYRDVQQVYVDDILANMNNESLLENALKFPVPSYDIEVSTGIAITTFDVGFTRYLPYATISFAGENLTELFSIEMVSGIESASYDLSDTKVIANYNIEVMLNGSELAYASYRTNSTGTLVWESNGYIASGSITYNAEFTDFVDPYSGQILMGEPSENVPPSITVQVTFADVEITGQEYIGQ